MGLSLPRAAFSPAVGWVLGWCDRNSHWRFFGALKFQQESFTRALMGLRQGSDFPAAVTR